MEATLEPLSDLRVEECSRFRLLIIGRSGTGKSSLVKAVFGPALGAAFQKRAGKANVNEDITAQCNKGLIIHCYEQDNRERCGDVEKFITNRSQEEHVAERLHAIWFCTGAPYMDGQIFEAGDELALSLSRKKVPIIFVFTKCDLMEARLRDRSVGEGTSDLDTAEEIFKERSDQIFQESNVDPMPQAFTTITKSETLYRLIEVTMQSVDIQNSRPPSGFARVRNLLFNRTSESNRPARLYEDSLDLSRILLAAAHGVNMPTKIAASIKLMEEKYWSAIVSSRPFRTFSLQTCIRALHKDIITIWNAYALDEFFLTDAFRRRMMVIVGDLTSQEQNGTNTAQRKIMVASAVASPAKRPEHFRCVMGYIVDLTLILQAIFQVVLENQLGGKVTIDYVHEIIYKFHYSERKTTIHDEIRTFVNAQQPLAKDSVVDKIESLIRENNEQKYNYAQKTSPFQSLLAILRFERTAKGVVLSHTTNDLVRELLMLPNLRSIVSKMLPSNVEPLLDFLLYLLENDIPSTCGISDANRKARRLVFELISETVIIPRSLYVANVKTVIPIRGHGWVFGGKHKGKLVTLKWTDGGYPDEIGNNFCKEALAWRSLSHGFILPLLGIFEKKSQLFLVSPSMPKGTLAEWRKHRPPSIKSVIHRLMLEVAQGVEYIHSEGIVHGDLTGWNVLLDSELHCRISDFGSAQHVDIAPTRRTGLSVHFAAPELWGRCTKCDWHECEGDYDGHDISGARKMETDVYAFGCLYYSIFFDTLPYEGETAFRIAWLVTTGEIPGRLESPMMEGSAWDLIQNCWGYYPSERPTMAQIVDKSCPLPLLCETPHTSLAPALSSRASSLSLPAPLASLPGITPPPKTLPSLITEILTVRLNSSMVNTVILDLICSLLHLPDQAICAELDTVSDVELLLEFLLHLLRNDSFTNLAIRGVNRKATRRLMFKLITMTNVIPKSLFITAVKAEMDTHAFAVGGFGTIFKGEYKGRLVALKVLNPVYQKDFCKEAVIWHSISHRFILPLLGVYEEKTCQFLVSPFMTNGTLAEWRRSQGPTVYEVQRLMLEVTEAIYYLHSEGIIHGDLHGSNILINSELHCQVTDFGLMRHSEATVAWSTERFVPNFAAPELFGLCDECCQHECDGCHEQHICKTMKTDVYAFGCLYYAVFFDTIPFQGTTKFHIMKLVTSGIRPDRLESPKMEDGKWDLIQDCWKHKPSERPTMEQIMKRLNPNRRLG